MKNSKEIRIEGQPAIEKSSDLILLDLDKISEEQKIDVNYSNSDRIEPARKGESMERELDIRFEYHTPKGSQSARYVVIRAIAKELGRAITRWCPPSRERELALTALDTVVMWANASIARRES